MPQVIIGVALLGAAFAAPGALLATTLSTILFTSGLMSIMGGIASALIKPRLPSFGVNERGVTIRQPISPRVVVYGKRGKLGGVITFIHEHGTNKEFISLVITLATHRVKAINTMYFGAESVPLDGSGNATGKYAGFVFVEKRLGADNQTALTQLQTDASGKWTSDHKQLGCAHVHVRIKLTPDKFPNGLPNITFDMEGKDDLYDHRTSTTAVGIALENPTLWLTDYLENTRFGLRVARAEIPTAKTIAAANACEEDVSLLAGGTHKRYIGGGSFTTAEDPKQVIEALLSAMAGQMVPGKWEIYPGIWRAPTITLTQADLREPPTITPLLSRRDQANAVKGTYVAPSTGWQPDSYPSVKDAAAVTEDGEEIYDDLPLPFTTDGIRAQRIAQIHLRRKRQQLSMVWPSFLATWRLQPPEVVSVTYPTAEWTAKAFEVEILSFAQGRGRRGGSKRGEAPVLGIDVQLRSTDANVYAWVPATDEKPVPVMPTPALPDPTTVGDPGTPTAGSGGGGPGDMERVDGIHLTQMLVQWTAPADQNVLEGGAIELQYKKTADSNWSPAGFVDGSMTRATITNISDGVQYDVRVRSVNVYGVRGTWKNLSSPHTVSGGTSNFTGNVDGDTAATVADGAERARGAVEVTTFLIKAPKWHDSPYRTLVSNNREGNTGTSGSWETVAVYTSIFPTGHTGYTGNLQIDRLAGTGVTARGRLLIGGQASNEITMTSPASSANGAVTVTGFTAGSQTVAVQVFIDAGSSPSVRGRFTQKDDVPQAREHVV